MRHIRLLASKMAMALAATLVVLLSSTGLAVARKPVSGTMRSLTKRGCTYSNLADTKTGLQYMALYRKAVSNYRAHKIPQHPGRNILCWGIRKPDGKTVRASILSDLSRSIPVLDRMVHLSPAPAPPAYVSSSSGAVSASVSAVSTSSSLPTCTWLPESGGSYTAVNSSSGARGKYQMLPSTYAEYGGDGSWSPADQEKVAHRLYAALGGRPWVNC